MYLRLLVHTRWKKLLCQQRTLAYVPLLLRPSGLLRLTDLLPGRTGHRPPATALRFLDSIRHRGAHGGSVAQVWEYFQELGHLRLEFLEAVSGALLCEYKDGLGVIGHRSAIISALRFARQTEC